MKKFLIFLAKSCNYFAGISLAYAMPIGKNLFPFPDFYIFLPLGAFLLLISYYFTFEYKP